MATAPITPSRFRQTTYYLHSVIVLILMFGFSHLPPIGPVTPMGMSILGIFIALIYGWSTVGMIWPSLLGLIALGFSDYTTVKASFMAGFGHDTVLFAFFVMLFAAMVDQAGITRYLATQIISCKLAVGRPWLLSFFILLAAFIISALVSIIGSIIICWNIFYNICDELHFRPQSKYPTLMIIGIAYASLLGYQVFPFRLLSLILLNTLHDLSGIQVNFLLYTGFMLFIGILCLFCFLLLCKFVFKPDITPFQNQSVSFAEKTALSAYQKKVLLLLIALILSLLLPGLLPAQWPVTRFLNTLGATGTTVLLLVAAVFLRHDGKPFVQFEAIVKQGAVWDVIILLAAAMPISAALTAEGTGIREFIITLLNPLFAGKSALLFSILVLIIANIITNFANNMVTGIVFMPIVYSFSLEVGANPIVLTVLLSLLLAVALVTPAASAPAALVHGNVGWINTNEAAFYGTCISLMSVLIAIFVGIPLGSWLFPF